MTLKSSWWKILGMILVITSVYLGLTTKTGPGVARVYPAVVNPVNVFELEVTGYNTSFIQGKSPLVWLKYKDHIICASGVNVIDEKHLQVRFGPIEGRIDSVSRIAVSVLIEDDVNGLFLGLDMVQLKFDSDSIVAIANCETLPRKIATSYYSFPFRTTLYESIRNLHFHVPMWFTMITLLLISFITGILFLNTSNHKYDQISHAFASVGLLFGIIGIITGSLWARFTWGTYWTADPKLNGAAVAVLMYIAYQILRSSIEDEDKVARISAVYNILAYPIFIVLIIVLPIMAEFSLHPNSGDSVGFKEYDLNSNLRMVFYPAVLGWILTGTWIAQIAFRIKKLQSETGNYE
jgi:heme exporter protein C